MRSTKLTRRLRARLVVALGGAAAGYYLGAKAGRERYEQVNRLLGRLRQAGGGGEGDGPAGAGAGAGAGADASARPKLRALVDLGVERARHTVDRLTGSLWSASAPPTLEQDPDPDRDREPEPEPDSDA